MTIISQVLAALSQALQRFNFGFLGRAAIHSEVQEDSPRHLRKEGAELRAEVKEGQSLGQEWAPHIPETERHWVALVWEC